MRRARTPSREPVQMSIFAPKDPYWAANYTFVDGPLARVYDTELENCNSYDYKGRCVEGKAYNIFYTLPTKISVYLAKLSHAVSFFREFASEKRMPINLSATKLEAHLVRHMLAGAVQEHGIVAHMKKLEQQLKYHPELKDQVVKTSKELQLPRNTGYFAEPVRFDMKFPQDWIKPYREVYYDDVSMLKSGFYLTNLEEFALNYCDGYTKRALVDRYLLKKCTLFLSEQQIEDLIYQFKAVYDQEQRLKIKHSNNSQRRRRAKRIHVLRTNGHTTTYDSLPKVKPFQLTPSAVRVPS